VSDDSNEATLERVHGFGLVEESYKDEEYANVIPLTNAPDGTLVQATALDGYLGMIEIRSPLVLPKTLNWRSDDGVPIMPLLISSDPEQSAIGGAILQIQALVERHNARVGEPEPAKVVRLANNGQQAPTEPAPAPCTDLDTDESNDPGSPTRVVTVQDDQIAWSRVTRDVTGANQPQNPQSEEDPE
jgi:hypothetical protein